MAKYGAIAFSLHHGYLELRIGPMFAGKTTDATFRATCHSENGNTVLYIGHSSDCRETKGGMDGKFTSHNPSNVFITEKVKTTQASRLSEVDVSSFDVIIVDEGQFFPDLKDTVLNWVNVMSKHVIVYGLDSDKEQEPIGQIIDLISKADHYEKLMACCRMCIDDLLATGYKGSIPDFPAPFTTVVPGNCVKDQIQVGGAETYIAVCRKHLGVCKAKMLSC